MMFKKIIASVALVATVAVSAAMFAAFEAHVINVTAHIENSLEASTYGIDFGTVFPQEYILDESFDIGLSDSFMAQDRANEVSYRIVQKDKGWTLNFGGDDVNTHNRTLLFIDPDQYDSHYTIGGGNLTITTDSNDVEDLFGTLETFGDVTAPRMMIPMGGNFTIETKVTVNPTNYYQSGGILVYGSDGNVVRLEATNWSLFGMGDRVYMESQESQVKVGKRSASISDTTDVYLKLTRTGNLFRGYYKENAGDAWVKVLNTVPDSPSLNDFDNEFIGNHPKVGLSAINADPTNHSAFDAVFDYVTFNGDYLSLCKFLSKMKSAEELNECDDINHPSYYIEDGTPGPSAGDECIGINDNRIDARGVLTRINDISDTWTVDLKVPPVSGYVGQDWPASCVDWTIPEDSQDYGCDLWIEVTGISEYNPQR